MRIMAWGLAVATLATSATAWAAEPPLDPRLKLLADSYVAARLDRDPHLTLRNKIIASPEYDARLPDRTPAGLERFDRRVDRLAREIDRLDARRFTGGSRVLHALLREELTVAREARVCRQDRWDISSFESLVSDVQAVAARQPVGSPAARARAISRWSAYPAMLDQHIANLRQGLESGHTVPKIVAERVAAQVDKTLEAGIAGSPYLEAARQDHDPVFTRQMRAIVETAVNPALKRFSRFLKDEYRPRTRETLGIWSIPEGDACYRALLRKHTTSTLTPAQLRAAIGARNAQGVAQALKLGLALYGLDDLAAISERARSDPAEKLGSAEKMLALAKDIVARSRQSFVPLFHKMPTQGVAVRAYPPERQGLGLTHALESSKIRGGPATYWVPTDNVAAIPRSVHVNVSLHEAFPGHMMVDSRYLDSHPLFRLNFLASYNEGWAQYAETLDEDGGFPRTPTGKIILGPVDGRLALLDLGIHEGRWTIAQARTFWQQNGGNLKRLDDSLVRQAAWPGYAVSYEAGRGEISALRAEAEAALGSRFDIRDFHAAVLGNGPVPLTLLRRNVEQWIAREKATLRHTRLR